MERCWETFGSVIPSADLQIGDRMFPLGQQVEHAQPGGICEGLADPDLHFEDLVFGIGAVALAHTIS